MITTNTDTTKTEINLVVQDDKNNSLDYSPGRGRGSRLISAKQAKLKIKSLLYRGSIYTHYTELYVVRVGSADS